LYRSFFFKMANPDALLSKKWGDQDDLDEFDSRDMRQEITTEAIPDTDGSIRKTVEEYQKNEKGQTVKIIKKVRMYKSRVKINKSVEERKKWKKFGECTNLPRGLEQGITTIGDEVFLDMVAGEQDDSKEKKEVVIPGIICRNCGKAGDHWTLKCPYPKSSTPFTDDSAASRRPETTTSSSADAPKGTYVIPSMRRGASSSGSAPPSGGEDPRSRRDESATIRVTNLSEDTKESDLSELFRTFGPISRIYLAKDKVTGLSKGFAFINFIYREDAAKAIERLSGKFGYDHLILHLEWAKPSNK